MTREFLKNLGVGDAAIDQILDENMSDIGKEKRKTDAAETKLAAAKTDLETANGNLAAAQGELETLKKAGGDMAAVQKQLTDLQAKYDTDTQTLQAQLADRDYADAISRAISGKALKFTSKSAERAFTAALREKKLAVKDGELEGLDDFIKAQREADPDAFASNKPTPRIVTRTGPGGPPPQPKSRAAQIAEQMNQSLYGTIKKE